MIRLRVLIFGIAFPSIGYCSDFGALAIFLLGFYLMVSAGIFAVVWALSRWPTVTPEARRIARSVAVAILCAPCPLGAFDVWWPASLAFADGFATSPNQIAAALTSMALTFLAMYGAYPTIANALAKKGQ